MTNEINKLTGNELAAAAALSVPTLILADKKHRNPSGACNRLMQAAALLPEQEFLGWQFSAGKDGQHQAFALASAGAAIKPEDLEWIFQPCAVAQAAQTPPCPLAGEERRIYLLRKAKPDPDTSDEQEYLSDYSYDEDDSYYENNPQKKAAMHARELLDELEMKGAILRALALPKSAAGRGVILLSLPGELSLRLQAALRMALPELEASPLAEEGPLGEEDLLSGFLFSTNMRDLLSGLMLPGANHRDAEPGVLDITVEDLDLSVRSYNCLKRNGINSTSDLAAYSLAELLRLRRITKKSAAEVLFKMAELLSVSRVRGSAADPEDAGQPEKKIGPSAIEKLDALIGLEGVKRQVKRIAAFAKLRRRMAADGGTSAEMALNMEFTGNPGTAKTTVARIMAAILREEGLLPGGELIEVGRADLIASYEGQTAGKVKKVFERARGNLLFIDEAYSLLEGWEGEFGDEAIATIVQEMENNRKDTVVIFAGYPDKMQDFFARNPGLRSRVPFQIHFADYSPEEMAQIAALEAKKRGFSIQPGAQEKLTALCKMACASSDAGNGRFCRNLVESAILDYAVRTCEQEDAAQPLVLEAEDFCLPQAVQKPARPSIGFCGPRPAARRTA